MTERMSAAVYRTERMLGWSETDFQHEIEIYATERGWLRIHIPPSYVNADGRIATAIRGDKGYPDLTLARGGRIVYAELKSTKGRVSREQRGWLEALAGVDDWVLCNGSGAGHGPVRVCVWRPSHWVDGTIQRVLL